MHKRGRKSPYIIHTLGTNVFCIHSKNRKIDGFGQFSRFLPIQQVIFGQFWQKLTIDPHAPNCFPELRTPYGNIIQSSVKKFKKLHCMLPPIKQGHIHDTISRVRLGKGSNAQKRRQSKCVTDGLTDQWTDGVTYRVACTRLKI